MVIAGCMNQAKRILEKYDEILYGPAPEKLIGDVHRAIGELLNSKEACEFSAEEGPACTKEDKSNFIKKIVGAVSPIIPIAIRDKSLDGGYFRTALSLLAAAEFLFAQYESDVRAQANPAGVVGMCSSMHAELERSAIYNEELKPLRDFMKDMSSQYQTSLGLGASFVNDGGTRMRNKQKKSRGRTYNYGQFFQAPGALSGQQHPQSWAVASSQGETRPNGMGRGLSFGAGRGVPVGMGRGQVGFVDARARGLCFRFQIGNCMRGNTCRFTHARC